jgi:hypothetical protein
MRIMSARWIAGLVIVTGIVVAGVWVIGQPRSLDTGAVDREIAAIDSTVAEAHLLAEITAEGDAWDRASSARAIEMADALSSSATRLETSTLPQSRKKDAATASDLAGQTASIMKKWAAHPPSPEGAKKIDEHIRRIQDELDRVAP